jgi:hypothetical protein
MTQLTLKHEYTLFEPITKDSMLGIVPMTWDLCKNTNIPCVPGLRQTATFSFFLEFSHTTLSS